MTDLAGRWKRHFAPTVAASAEARPAESGDSDTSEVDGVLPEADQERGVEVPRRPVGDQPSMNPCFLPWRRSLGHGRPGRGHHPPDPPDDQSGSALARKRAATPCPIDGRLISPPTRPARAEARSSAREWRLGHERSETARPQKRIDARDVGFLRLSMIHHPKFRHLPRTSSLQGIVTGASPRLRISRDGSASRHR